jgi:hypothetical protein
VHLHPLLHFRGQELGQLVAHLAVIQDVRVDVDVIARARHRIEHRPVGAGTVDQQAAVVAFDEGICGRSVLSRRPGGRQRQRASREGRKQRRDYCDTAKAKSGPAHGGRPYVSA